MADTHKNFKEFQRERNLKLIGDEITTLIDQLGRVSLERKNRLKNLIGARLAEYGDNRYSEGYSEGNDNGYNHGYDSAYCSRCDNP